MNEIWKDIKGYEGIYQISNLGRVKRISHIRKDVTGRKLNISEKILKPNLLSSGYMQYSLCKNRKRKCYLGHVLVANHFIENPNRYPIVNHKDENKANNVSTNLEWCTYKYNNNYGTRNERLSKNHSLSGANSVKKKVSQYDRNMNLIDTFSSITEASNKTKILIANISLCCKNKRKTAGNYIWKYAI